MAAFRKRDLVLISEQVSSDSQITSVVASSEADLGGRIRCCAPPAHERPDMIAGEETRQTRRGSAGRRLSGEEITCARKAHTGRVQHGRRKNMRFLQTHHLLSERCHVGGVKIRAGWREVRTVIDRIYPAQKITSWKVMIQSDGAEVIADGLKRAVERFRDS